MKKELLLIILLIIPLISAIDISLSKPDYQPQETFQAEITGNFIDTLKLENILLYKEDIPRSTPTISDLTKSEDTYYLYIILPNQEGNFSIKIENTKYTESGLEKTEDIVKEFKIEKTNQSALQINPGFIITDEEVSIKVKALFSKQDISAIFEEDTQNFTLAEDVEKTITFLVEELTPSKTNLKINDYDIPVFIIEKLEEETNISEEQNKSETNNETIEEENETKINITEMTEEEIESLSCSDIGEKCEDNEECDGESEISLEGPCCIGSCIEEKETSYKLFIGFLIVIIIIASLAYFYKKSKDKQRFKKHKKVLEEKSEKFNQRMGGREVSGGLSAKIKRKLHTSVWR